MFQFIKGNAMTRFVFVLLALVAVGLVCGPAKAQDLYIALSPHVSEEQRQAQGEAVIRFLAEEVEPGESAVILNAYDLTPVATFAVPENRAYENPRAKLTANRAALVAILTLEPELPRASNSVDCPINLPGLLRHMAQAYPGGGDLIIIGSPLYDMPRESHVSMASGGVPGDGLIQATRGVSPFGAADAGDALSSYRVHFAAIDPEWALHDRHAFAVERFITLLIEAHGAELVSFADDMETVFSQVRRGAERRVHGFVLEETNKREMLHYRANTAPRALARDMSGGDAAYTGPDVIDGPVEFGLYWPCEACDLDLHVRHGEDGRIFSYLDSEPGPDGAFYKNFRLGPDDDRSLEVIDLEGPVDLSAVLIAVNLYAGHQPGGAPGELRITIDGHTYVRPFVIAAETGNLGGGLYGLQMGDEPNDAWVVTRADTTLRN